MLFVSPPSILNETKFFEKIRHEIATALPSFAEEEEDFCPANSVSFPCIACCGTCNACVSACPGGWLGWLGWACRHACKLVYSGCKRLIPGGCDPCSCENV